MCVRAVITAAVGSGVIVSSSGRVLRRSPRRLVRMLDEPGPLEQAGREENRRPDQEEETNENARGPSAGGIDVARHCTVA